MDVKTLIEILSALDQGATVQTVMRDRFDDPQWDMPKITQIGQTVFVYHPWEQSVIDYEARMHAKRLQRQEETAEKVRRQEDEILRQAEKIRQKRNLTGA